MAGFPTNTSAGGAAGVVSTPDQAQGMQSSNYEDPNEQEDDADEEKEVKEFFKDYDQARKFDEPFRKQVAIDRRYAAGTSDLSWAVTTNLIGAFIDILVALLYARDPDVLVQKAPQTDNAGTVQLDAFARTLMIVISQLWAKGNLRRQARKGVRSVLSNAEGWFKCIMVTDKKPQPDTEKALNDAQETLAHLRAQQQLLEDPDGMDDDEREAAMDEQEALMEVLQEKIELAVNKMFVIDFIKTELMQISTDVECIQDHVDADWNANEVFMTKEEALAKFPDLDADDLKHAKKYYQLQPTALTSKDIDSVLPQGTVTAESSLSFTTTGSEAQSVPFVRAIEQWCRIEKKIRTAIEGVNKWAKKPYSPPYPTSRFYPYFYFAFYEVDGSRHAQSLSWRMYKLQDEYSTTRSNFRLARERSLPGVFVNATQLDDEQMKKVEQSKVQEFTALKPADPDTPLANLFAQKPTGGFDPRIYDLTYILNDMERISGVQEALSAAISSPGNPKTATEANIQQSGTNARTTSDRDALEWMLTDLAKYTAELALQCFTTQEVQKMAGPKAFWPGPDPDNQTPGLSLEDLFNMVEVKIVAGTTGKPKQQQDQQAWGTILPLIRELIGQIEQALAGGNIPLANALTELVKETMLRMGDESDVDRFIPKVPPPGTPGAGAPPQQPKPQVSISLRGELPPQVAAVLAAPDLPPPPAPPGGPTGPGGPGAPPGAPPPGPGGSPPPPVAPPGVPAGAHPPQPPAPPPGPGPH